MSDTALKRNSVGPGDHSVCRCWGQRAQRRLFYKHSWSRAPPWDCKSLTYTHTHRQAYVENDPSLRYIRSKWCFPPGLWVRMTSWLIHLSSWAEELTSSWSWSSVAASAGSERPATEGSRLGQSRGQYAEGWRALKGNFRNDRYTLFQVQVVWLQPASLHSSCVAQCEPSAGSQSSLLLPAHLPTPAGLPAEQRLGAGALGPSRWGSEEGKMIRQDLNSGLKERQGGNMDRKMTEW